jgi:hypothetical protein
MELNEANLGELRDKLKKSLIFNLSLTSKELFHSNLWAWLIESADTEERKIQGIKIFFDKFVKTNGQIEVKREEKNLDLQIKCGDFIYVIENKVKSIPSEEQLQKYSDKISSNKVGIFLLTTLVKPDFDLPPNWSILSYAEIAERVELHNNDETDRYKKTLLDDYVLVLRSLDQLISFNGECKKYNFYLNASEGLENHHIKLLEDLRISDIYVKRRTSELFATIERKFKGQVTGLKVEQWFSNKSGVITIYFKEENKFEIGIQIQRLQYRYYVKLFDEKLNILDNGKVSDIPDNILDPLMKEGWFYEKPQDSLHTSMRKQFCSYLSKSENSIFVYQYKKLVPNATYESITNDVAEDIQKADGILKRYKNLFC